MSEGVSEVSKRTSERVSAAEGASEASSPKQANEWAVRANGRASGPVLKSLFLFVSDHSAVPWNALLRGFTVCLIYHCCVSPIKMFFCSLFQMKRLKKIHFELGASHSCVLFVYLHCFVLIMVSCAGNQGVKDVNKHFSIIFLPLKFLIMSF